MAMNSWRKVVTDPTRYKVIEERLANPDIFQDALMKIMDLYEKDSLVRIRERTSVYSEFDRGYLAAVHRLRELMKSDPQQ